MSSTVLTNTIEGRWTVGSIVREVRCTLQAVGIEPAAQEGTWLLEHALGLSRLRQTVDPYRILSAAELNRVRQVVARRVAREPLQYILGSQEFCGLEFEVNPEVLIPRPETELLLQPLLRRLPVGNAPIVVDVGTGSGCLAVVLARTIPHGTVLATDLSSSALETARRNADRHEASAVTWLQGDLLAPLEDRQLEQKVSVIMSNPPYISEAEWPTLQPEVRLYEPRTALMAGPRGTELHERLLDQAVSFLAPGGVLIMEMGQGQSRFLRELVKSNRAYQSAETLFDDAGIERVLIAERAGT